uniref:Uncharacterized protein n=1 Tax=Helianthus annuus TaxID=4232 RepID=A0A251VDW5_HELAN
MCNGDPPDPGIEGRIWYQTRRDGDDSDQESYGGTRSVMKVQMSLQQTQMDRFYLLISLLWMRSSIRNLARFEDVFQLVGISMVKCAMVAYNTSMVAYAQMADSMDMGGHLYTYNEVMTSLM